MRVRHESRMGNDRRLNDLFSGLNRDVQRRWGKDQRSQIVDENEIYKSTPEISESYWETLFNIPSRF